MTADRTFDLPREATPPLTLPGPSAKLRCMEGMADSAEFPSQESDEIALADLAPEAGDPHHAHEPGQDRREPLADGAVAPASVWPEDQLERAVAAILFAASEPLS